jgi:hypothetical protein
MTIVIVQDKEVYDRAFINIKLYKKKWWIKKNEHRS